ncbi:MAG: hypothetical protein EOP82_29485 [Variovorax sp.]|nr:MAG: hypothetical protein EOP82_29485 [Variovorax sp.]
MRRDDALDTVARLTETRSYLAPCPQAAPGNHRDDPTVLNRCEAGASVMQKCGECGTFNFYPKLWCIECGSRLLTWTDAKPLGTV